MTRNCGPAESAATSGASNGAVELLPARGAYGDHLTPMVLVSMNTGIRQGELFNLRWADVDMTRAMLTVRGGGAKSGQTRHVPLNAEALGAFKTWRKQTDGDGLVFIGRSGGRFDNVKKGWAAVLMAARDHRLSLA